MLLKELSGGLSSNDASRSLDVLGPLLGPVLYTRVPNLLTLCLRAFPVTPLFPNARLIHTVEVIGSNPIAPTISSTLTGISDLDLGDLGPLL